jgi:hypothetical protein
MKVMVSNGLSSRTHSEQTVREYYKVVFVSTNAPPRAFPSPNNTRVRFPVVF